jgi:hypothetical protein
MAFLLRFKEECESSEPRANTITQTATNVRAEQEDQDFNRNDEETLPRPESRANTKVRMASQTVTRVANEQSDSDRSAMQSWASTDYNSIKPTGKPRPVQTSTKVAKEDADRSEGAAEQAIPDSGRGQRAGTPNSAKVATQTSTEVAKEDADTDRTTKATRVIPSATDSYKPW